MSKQNRAIRAHVREHADDSLRSNNYAFLDTLHVTFDKKKILKPYSICDLAIMNVGSGFGSIIGPSRAHLLNNFEMEAQK